MIVEMIAQPILEAIEAMESASSHEPMTVVPQLKLVWQNDREPVEFGGHQLDENMIQKVQEYLQEMIESREHPTILH